VVGLAGQPSDDTFDGADPALIEKIAEIADRLRAGDRVDGESLARLHPEWAGELNRLLPAIQMMADLGASSMRAQDQDAQAPNASAGQQLLGDFRIIREIGRGGMGIVYEATQLSLGRRVALKVLHGAAADTKQLARFQIEVQAAALLTHPNIVPIYAVSYKESVPYYAMQFVDGQTLADVIHEMAELESGSTESGVRPEDTTVLVGALKSGRFATASPEQEVTPSPVGQSSRQSAMGGKRRSSPSSALGRQHFLTVAWLGYQAADALHYAHEQAVVHRDIKPANLLVDGSGKLWITDFGLAQLQGKSGLTATGDLLGTLRYMSPEQATARRSEITHKTDIYSLGATLYELAVLRPAFSGEDRRDILRKIVHEEPTAPRTINRAIPPDLETIILKAMAKEPGSRYPAADDLADDLKRFLEGRPIRARRPTVTDRLAKWTRRHAPLVGLSAVMLSLMVIISVAAAVLIARQRTLAENRRIEAVGQKADALRQREDARRISVLMTLDRALALCEQGDVATGLLWMNRALQSAGRDSGDVVRLIRQNLAGWRPEQATLVRVLPHRGWVWRVAFSPDGRRIVTTSGDESAGWGEIRLWDTVTGQQIGKPLDHNGVIHSIAFSPDGLTILAGDTGHEARLWDMASKRRIAVLPHQSSITSVAFSPDGQTALTGSADGIARLWDVASGRPICDELRFLDPVTRAVTGPVTYVAFRPDGETFLVGGPDNSIWVHDAKTRTQVGIPLKHSGPVTAVDLSRDGMILLVGCYNGLVRLWDLTTRRQIGDDMKHQGPIVAVSLSPDGKIALTASGDTTARFWDTATAQQICPPMPHGGWVVRTAFSADGRSALTASGDNTVRLWEVPSGRLISSTLRHGNTPIAVAFEPHGRRILTGSEDNFARLWEIQPAARQQFTLGEGGAITSASFSTGGRTLLVRREDGRTDIVDLTTVRSRHGSVRLTSQVFSSAGGPPISSDGAKAIASTSEGAAQLWDLTTNQLVGRTMRGHSQSLNAGAFSPDGTILLTGSYDKTARLWNTASAEPVGDPIKHDAAVMSVGFSPDASRVLTGGKDNKAQQWEAAPSHRRIGPPLLHRGWVRAMAFSPDGQTILTGSSDGLAQLWDAHSGARRGPALEHRAVVLAVAISPDGKTLLIGCENGTARFWDVATFRPIGAPLRHGGAVRALAFDTDNRTARTVSADGFLRRWDVPEPLPDTEQRIRLWLRATTGMELDEAGGINFLAASEWAQAHADYENSGGPPR
jgi:WD40 repeat protein/serine/threonine protein kinase